MSRYESMTELREIVRLTIATDHCGTGLPTDPSRYNMSGIIRDMDIIGDRTYGYTQRDPGHNFGNILRRNLRGS